MRLHAYLRQLLSETPAQKLQICAAVKRKDWGVLVGCMDTEVTEGACLDDRLIGRVSAPPGRLGFG